MFGAINELYVVVMALSFWVAVRFVPVFWRRVRDCDYERLWLSAALILHNFGFGLNDLYFYIARLHSTPNAYSVSPAVVFIKLTILAGAVCWLIGIDGTRRAWPLLVLPILASFALAWILPVTLR